MSPTLRRWTSALLAGLMLLQPALVAAVHASDDAGDEVETNGGGVTVALMQNVLSEGRIDFKATLDLLTSPNTLYGALGGVAGFMVASKVGAMLMPPGVGMFLQVLPGFLGGAIGFEFGQGRSGTIDPMAMLFQVVASSAGYAAFHFLLGATAPGWALMAGASLFGLVANLLIRKKPSREEGDAELEPGSLDLASATVGSTAAESGSCEDLAATRIRLQEQYRRLMETDAKDTSGLEAAHGRYLEAQRTLAGCRALD